MTNKYLGEPFDAFLEEEGTETALKRVVAMSFARLFEEKNLSVAKIAARLETSPNQVYWLLDDTDTSVTLRDIARVACAAGGRGRGTVE